MWTNGSGTNSVNPPVSVWSARVTRMWRAQDLGLERTLEFVVELEVAGFDQKELKIEVSDHTLSVIGERTEETEKKKEKTHQVEITKA